MTLFGFAAVFFPETAEYPLEIHKVFLRVYSLFPEKIQAAKLQSTSKAKIFLQDKKNCCGKADACCSSFLKYWTKRLLLKRILSYELPHLFPATFFVWFSVDTLLISVLYYHAVK